MILSNQYWAGEQALAAWRRNADHRYAEMQGILHIVADYCIRVGPRVWHRGGEKDAGFYRSGQPPNGPVF